MAQIKPRIASKLNKQVSVELPTKLAQLLGGQKAAQKMVLELAIVELVRQHTLSSGQGAEELGLNRQEFMELLAEHDIPSFELLPGETLTDHLGRGKKALRRLRGEPA